MAKFRCVNYAHVMFILKALLQHLEPSYDSQPHLLTIGDVLDDVFGFIMLTVVLESSAEYQSASELRSGLEKGSGEVKIEPDVMGSLHWRTLATALLLPLVAWPH